MTPRRRLRQIWTRAYRARHHEEIKARDRARYAERRDQILANKRHRYATDPEYRERKKQQTKEHHRRRRANAI